MIRRISKSDFKQGTEIRVIASLRTIMVGVRHPS